MSSTREMVREESDEVVRERRLHLIASLDLSPHERRDLAFLALGMTSALSIERHALRGVGHEDGRIEDELRDETAKTRKALEGLGLRFTLNESPDQEVARGYSFLIARDDEVLARLVAAQESGDKEEYGRLLGYPETAIAAYRTNEAFDYRRELPAAKVDALAEEGTLAFLNFTPSRSHWEDELAFVRANQERVKKEAPLIYDKIMNA